LRFTACGKKPALPLLLSDAAGYLCGKCLVLNSALQSAEKLDFVLAFGWRSGSPLRELACFQRRL
jgi:hypothetical protein